MDDSQLIIACKKQNRDAQKALYEKYAPVMMAVCIRYCGDVETARDLLHDGFIRVFTQISSYSGKGSDRKSTRLNSSHVRISYAVFCLKKKIYRTHLREEQYFLNRRIVGQKHNQTIHTNS